MFIGEHSLDKPIQETIEFPSKLNPHYPKVNPDGAEVAPEVLSFAVAVFDAAEDVPKVNPADATTAPVVSLLFSIAAHDPVEDSPNVNPLLPVAVVPNVNPDAVTAPEEGAPDVNPDEAIDPLSVAVIVPVASAKSDGPRPGRNVLQDTHLLIFSGFKTLHISHFHLLLFSFVKEAKRFPQPRILPPSSGRRWLQLRQLPSSSGFIFAHAPHFHGSAIFILLLFLGPSSSSPSPPECFLLANACRIILANCFSNSSSSNTSLLVLENLVSSLTGHTIKSKRGLYSGMIICSSTR